MRGAWRVVRVHLSWLLLGALVGACGFVHEDEAGDRAAAGKLIETSPTSPPLLGRIVVNHDEWTLSNTGFSQTGNAAVFARNVAQWFTGGQPGHFLAYSTNFGLRESSLATVLSNAGHTWTVTTSVPFTLSTLRQYDAVFVGGDGVDTTVLTQYVREGGNVYLMAGTGAGGAAAEAARWNPFLQAFGLQLMPTYNLISGNLGGTLEHPVLSGVPSLYYNNGNSILRLDSSDPHTAIIHAASGQGMLAVYDGCPGANNCRQPACIQIRLSSHNLFLLEDYSQGHDVQGKVAAGGNITLTDFAVGAGVPDSNTAQVLVAGGHLTLSRGGVWGDAWYGGDYTTDPSVVFPRGTAAHGTPIDFAARFAELRGLSSQLAGLAVNGMTTVEPWGGVMLRGTAPDVNIFQVNANSFTGAKLLSIDAPAGSLAVVNISGSAATFTGFGHSFSGGIDQHGVLYNFPEATSINADGFGFWGTVLAPQAHIRFSNGSWDGGIYARSLTGNAEGHINALSDRDIGGSCGGHDNGCDGGGPLNTYYRDADGDGYGNAAVSTQACSAPAGYVSNSSDCNDSNASVKPGAAEACNGVDDNCNGSIDEGVGGGTTYYRDADGDGRGNASESIQACSAPAGYVSDSSDCNDADATLPRYFYQDSDGDGYASSEFVVSPAPEPMWGCAPTQGYSAVGGDCNDGNPNVHPGATEVCYDGVDNNCNYVQDEGCPAITCSAYFSAPVVHTNGTATFGFQTSGPVPAGSRAYLYGTRNGVVDAYGNYSYDQTTFSFLVGNYPGLEGYYTRYVVIRGPTNVDLCTTNTVSQSFVNP